MTGLFDRLVDDLHGEIVRREPRYPEMFPIAVPRFAALADTDPGIADLADAFTAGLERLRTGGLRLVEGLGDPVGAVIADSLIDAALAERGHIDLVPEPGDTRRLEEVLAADFQTVETVDGRRAHVARWPGRPLLVVNALGISLEFWRPLLTDQRSGFRPIVAENRCGNLLAGGMESDVGLTTHAEDLAAVIAATGFPRVDVLAWCNGGRIAIDLARRWPERVGTLVLLATTLRGIDGVAPRPSPFEGNLQKAFEKVIARPDFAAPMARLLGQLFAPPDWDAVAADPEARARTLFARAAADLVKALGAPMASGEALLNYAARTARDEGYPLREALEALAHPVLVVTGDSDSIISNELTREAAAYARNARAVEVTGAGHYIQNLQYRYMVHAMRSFVNLENRQSERAARRVRYLKAMRPAECVS
ncbi:alpha/beta fold hydrolase [Azospirillum soli]|uniref:alpha/beta fold hydrolase n=1 Tax=Azospirillum soli TaxID=1304799 RepID=UPI001AE51AA6|nr:alpha/beta hydrolase [Azospirillum soli]MBP2314303.1 pimeloyl-ACP methyl ester carboxylesterase [Azospirillum soli]